MVETGPGRYQSTRPVPVGGNWKSILRLAHNQVLASVPVYMPPDLLLRAPAVQVVGEKSASFVPEQHVLLRETHAGPAWPRTLAYALIASLTLLWFGTLALAFRAVSIGVAGPGAPRRPRPARLVPRPAGA